MAFKDARYPSGIGSAKPAFGAEPKVIDDSLRRGNARAVSRIVIKLQQAQIQFCSVRPCPIAQRREKSGIRMFWNRDMDELDGATDKVRYPIHQLGENGCVFES